MRVTGPAYRVVFNPRLRDLGIAPTYLVSAYRADAPTSTVLDRPRANHAPGARFRIPETPAGLYMVLIFDGIEGGGHNTWEYLHVVDRDQRGPAPGVPLGIEGDRKPDRPRPSRRSTRPSPPR